MERSLDSDQRLTGLHGNVKRSTAEMLLIKEGEGDEVQALVHNWQAQYGVKAYLLIVEPEDHLALHADGPKAFQVFASLFTVPS